MRFSDPEFVWEGGQRLQHMEENDCKSTQSWGDANFGIEIKTNFEKV